VTKKSFLFLFLFLMQLAVFAQNKDRRAKYHSFGAQVIGSYFWGDVASSIKTIRSGWGLQYYYKVKSNIAFTVDANYVRLVADDESSSSTSKRSTADIYIRNLHMRNDVAEVGAHARFELYPCNDYFTKRKEVNYFGTIGLGVLYSNPRAKDSTGHWRNLQPIHTENKSYSSFTAYIPVSAGVSFKLANHIDLELELGYRFTFTDYLDDAKGEYVDPASLPSGDARYFSNRSAEPENHFNGHNRDLNYIQNDLGYPILTTPDGYSYVSSTATGQLRGTRFGLDGYFVAMVRVVYIIPRQ
jgi:hypothetical protein